MGFNSAFKGLKERQYLRTRGLYRRTTFKRILIKFLMAYRLDSGGSENFWQR